jgi:hypothetical protein
MPSLSSIIGQASRGADLYFVFRFLRLLTMKYESTSAYKLGIIDKKGKALKRSSELESTKEKASYTMLHRMVFKIRRILEKTPAGRFVNYAAALFLLKEQKNTRIWTDDGYMKSKLLEFLETDWKADAKFLKEEVDNMEKKSFKTFLSEKKSIEESQELQAMMALDDAGIEAVIDKEGQIIVDKKDKKKAEKALKKSFKKGGVPEIQYEEVKMDEAKGTAFPATIDTLKMIVREKQNQIVMFDKGQARVDLFTASAMVQVYDALKPATKKKFEDMIKSKEGFMKSQAFAMKMIG